VFPQFYHEHKKRIFFLQSEKKTEKSTVLKYNKLAIIWGQKPSKDSLKFLLKINYYFVGNQFFKKYLCFLLLEAELYTVLYF